MGMYLMRQIGTRGVYGDPLLPDFMVFLNWKEPPWFWYGFDHFLVRDGDDGGGAWRAGLRVRLAGVPVRASPASICRSSRRPSTYALMLAFFRNEMGFGGNNGFTDFKDILGVDLQQDATRVVLLVCTVFALGVSYLACRYARDVDAPAAWCAPSATPRAARGSLGFRVEHYKLWVFTLSAVHRRRGGRALHAAGRHHQPQ